jgi:hypothetical protein
MNTDMKKNEGTPSRPLFSNSFKILETFKFEKFAIACQLVVKLPSFLLLHFFIHGIRLMTVRSNMVNS